MITIILSDKGLDIEGLPAGTVRVLDHRGQDSRRPECMQPVTQARESDERFEGEVEHLRKRVADAEQMASRLYSKLDEARNEAKALRRRLTERAIDPLEDAAKRQRLVEEVKALRHSLVEVRDKLKTTEMQYDVCAGEVRRSDELLADTVAERDKYAASVRSYGVMNDEIRTILKLQLGDDVVDAVRRLQRERDELKMQLDAATNEANGLRKEWAECSKSYNRAVGEHVAMLTAIRRALDIDDDVSILHAIHELKLKAL